MRRPTSPTISPRRSAVPHDARAAPCTETYGAVTLPECPSPAVSMLERQARLRGWLHAYAAPISIVTGVVLVAVTAALRGGRAAGTATAIYCRHRDAALRHVRAVSPAGLEPARPGAHEAPGPLDDLRVHRRHVHPDRRRSPCPAGRRSAVLVVVWTGALVGVGLQTALADGAALARRAVLYRARLGGGLRVPATCCSNAGVAALVLLAAGGVVVHGRCRRLRAQAAQSAGPASSGSTRSSTSARCSPRSATTWRSGSPSSPTLLRAPRVRAARDCCPVGVVGQELGRHPAGQSRTWRLDCAGVTVCLCNDVIIEERKESTMRNQHVRTDRGAGFGHGRRAATGTATADPAVGAAASAVAAAGSRPTSRRPTTPHALVPGPAARRTGSPASRRSPSTARRSS